MSGMNEIECKEFSPKINWTDRACAGFVIRDHTGWFSKPNIDQGIFLLDLVQFENWCKIVLKDVEYIKGLLAKFPEIKLQSDKLIDFEFIIYVNYKKPIDTTNRNKLDQQLLEDAVRYLQFLKNRPYFKFSIDQRLNGGLHVAVINQHPGFRTADVERVAFTDYRASPTVSV